VCLRPCPFTLACRRSSPFFEGSRGEDNGLLTAASAEGVGLVVAFPEGRGTLRCGLRETLAIGLLLRPFCRKSLGGSSLGCCGPYSSWARITSEICQYPSSVMDRRRKEGEILVCVIRSRCCRRWFRGNRALRRCDLSRLIFWD